MAGKGLTVRARGAMRGGIVIVAASLALGAAGCGGGADSLTPEFVSQYTVDFHDERELDTFGQECAWTSAEDPSDLASGAESVEEFICEEDFAHIWQANYAEGGEADARADAESEDLALLDGTTYVGIFTTGPFADDAGGTALATEYLEGLQEECGCGEIVEFEPSE